jgi:hypothetical protein
VVHLNNTTLRRHIISGPRSYLTLLLITSNGEQFPCPPCRSSHFFALYLSLSQSHTHTPSLFRVMYRYKSLLLTLSTLLFLILFHFVQNSHKRVSKSCKSVQKPKQRKWSHSLLCYCWHSKLYWRNLQNESKFFSIFS